MNSEMLRDIIFISLLLVFIMLGIIAALQIKIYKYKHKIYFIRRDRERCNEVLFAAKDGYFCFVYPDQKVKDPQKEIKESIKKAFKETKAQKANPIEIMKFCTEHKLKQLMGNYSIFLLNKQEDIGEW